MSTAVQELIVDAVVIAAALWLVWSFGPESWRTAVRRRRAKPSYDTALHADALDGRTETPRAGTDCGPGCKH